MTATAAEPQRRRRDGKSSGMNILPVSPMLAIFCVVPHPQVVCNGHFGSEAGGVGATRTPSLASKAVVAMEEAA